MTSECQFTIRPYTMANEQGWLRCRVLAFLDSAYYDDVFREKDCYEQPAVELVAVVDGHIVGLIDVEFEQQPGTTCSRAEGPAADLLAGMIWHLGVHPDYRRIGIARALLEAAAGIARREGMARLEAWTRDDAFVNDWYRAMGFRWVQSYHHVYMGSRVEIDPVVACRLPGLRPVKVFAHYTGDDERIPAPFARVHVCNRYDLYL